jgi:hypothetical protein
MSMWLRLVSASLLVAGSASAQPAGVIDEANFTFTRAGAPYGTETFKIVRRLGAEGTEYVAQCTRTIEGRIVRTALTTDSAGSPTSYSRATTGSGQGQLTARRATNRLTVNEEGAQASSRDYVFAPGTLILDDDVIHQLYFVTWRDGRSLAFVSPGDRTTGQATLTEVGRENLAIGSALVPAVRFAFGSGANRREIWVDSSRRLLKVAHPAREIVGMRDLPPR